MPAPLVGAAIAVAARLAAKKIAQKTATKVASNAGTAVKVLSQAEKKAISLANARLRANIDKMEKSGNYKKVGNPAPKSAPVSKPAKPKPSTKEVVGRTMRKRAEPKLRPKDALLQQPATKLESLKKKQYLNQLMSKPVARNRNVPKPSTQSLTAREKLYEKLGEKAKVTVTKGKPFTKQDRAKARKAKFDKILTPVTPIGKARPGKRAGLPSHKVNVKLNTNRQSKPDTSRANEKPEIVARYAVGKKVKSARVIAPPKTKGDLVTEGVNAKNNPRNWDIADQRPKTTIAQGRGNTKQPPSVTTQRNPRTRQERREKRKARRADIRDRVTDIAGAKRADYTRPRMIKYVTGPKSAKPGTTKRMQIGNQTVSRTNDPRNAASDAGNMEQRLKAADNIVRQKAELKPLGQGLNKVSKKTQDKVDKTLETARILRNRLKAADRASKPTPRVRKRLSSTRPTTPKKK